MLNKVKKVVQLKVDQLQKPWGQAGEMLQHPNSDVNSLSDRYTSACATAAERLEAKPAKLYCGTGYESRS